jgi:hypothetical protein
VSAGQASAFVPGSDGWTTVDPAHPLGVRAARDPKASHDRCEAATARVASLDATLADAGSAFADAAVRAAAARGEARAECAIAEVAREARDNK